MSTRGIKTHVLLCLNKSASKGCIFAKIKIGDTSLMIFNCHLQATHTLGSKSCSTIRQQQLSEVRRFIQTKVHENPTCPWILGNKAILAGK